MKQDLKTTNSTESIKGGGEFLDGLPVIEDAHDELKNTSVSAFENKSENKNTKSEENHSQKNESSKDGYTETDITKPDADTSVE